MRGCAAYALPTKPEPDFVETFGIALAEKMLAGGGPIITTLTGGTGEAVGDTAVIVEAGDIAALAAALDRVVLEMSEHERRPGAARARARPVLRPGPGLRRPLPRASPPPRPRRRRHSVVIRPPSMTKSVPVTLPARSLASSSTRSATSSGG